ncbi:MAG TPA: hypothetical protein VHX65_16080 [Pirellulales bacterium]|nr:hypothetical protein [Pirellulales bacterium]
MLPDGLVAGAGVLGANVVGPGAVLGMGAKLGAGAKPGIVVVPGIGDRDGTALGPAITGAATPSEP